MATNSCKSRSLTRQEQPAGLVTEVDIEVVGDTEAVHGLEPDRARVQVEEVLGASLLAERLAHVREFDWQGLQRRCASAEDVVEGVGEFIVAIPLAFVQPIDEPLDDSEDSAAPMCCSASGGKSSPARGRAHPDRPLLAVTTQARNRDPCSPPRATLRDTQPDALARSQITPQSNMHACLDNWSGKCGPRCPCLMLFGRVVVGV